MNINQLQPSSYELIFPLNWKSWNMDNISVNQSQELVSILVWHLWGIFDMISENDDNHNIFLKQIQRRIETILFAFCILYNTSLKQLYLETSADQVKNHIFKKYPQLSNQIPDLSCPFYLPLSQIVQQFSGLNKYKFNNNNNKPLINTTKFSTSHSNFNFSISDYKKHLQDKSNENTFQEELWCSLEEMFQGGQRELNLHRIIKCSYCAKSCDNGNKSICVHCQGSGIVIHNKNTSTSWKICFPCKGQGFIQDINTFGIKSCSSADYKEDTNNPTCQICNNLKVISELRSVTVLIPSRCRDYDTLTFPGYGQLPLNSSYVQTPGDLTIIFRTKSHCLYKTTLTTEEETWFEHNHVYWMAGDLLLYYNISLIEALAGFSFNLHTIDNEICRIQSRPGIVYNTQHLYKLSAPRGNWRPNKTSRGQLYIRLYIVFPSNFDLLEFNNLYNTRQTKYKEEEENTIKNNNHLYIDPS